MRSAMQREPVESSTLASVGYDEMQYLLELGSAVENSTSILALLVVSIAN